MRLQIRVDYTSNRAVADASNLIQRRACHVIAVTAIDHATAYLPTTNPRFMRKPLFSFVGGP